MTDEEKAEEIAAVIVASPAEEILLAGVAAAYEEPIQQAGDHYPIIGPGSQARAKQEIRQMIGKEEPGWGHAISGQEQSESFTDFLNRYIPSWPALHVKVLIQELDSLPIHYEVVEGDRVLTLNEAATRAGDDDLYVRYFPAGTAAYDEPLPEKQTNPDYWGAVQDISELEKKTWLEENAWQRLNIGHGHGTESISAENFPQSEPLTDFLDRYIPDWQSLEPEQLADELIALSDQFQFKVFDEPATGLPGDFGIGAGISQHLLADPDRYSVKYFPPGTAAFASPAGEVSFSKMAHNEQAFDILIDTAHAWQHQANYIRETADDIRIAQRAQFAANVAFAAAKALQQNKASIVAAYLPDHMVGLSVYQVYPDRTALLNLVTVAPYLQPGNPEANIRGIGTGMVCKVTQDLLEQQVTQVCLKPLDEEAEKFWRNRGFEPKGREKLCVIDDVDRLLSSCQIQPDCPDQGDNCAVGNERQMARFTQPSIAGQLYARR